MAARKRRTAAGRVHPGMGPKSAKTPKAYKFNRALVDQFERELAEHFHELIEEAHTPPERDPFQDDLREMEDAHWRKRERELEAEEDDEDDHHGASPNPWGW